MIGGPFQDARFRRLFAGRVVTNVGDSLYFVAAMWLAYELTEDPFYTGLAGFLILIPNAFQFLVGPFVDEWSIRRTLVATQAVQTVVVLAIPVAHYYGVLTVWLVLAIMPFLTALNKFANPAMVAALPRMLDDDDLVAANSAFAIAKQGSDMVGYGITGAVIGVTGAVALYAVDAVTFLVAMALFLTVAVPSAEEVPNESDTPSGEAAASDAAGTDDESYRSKLRFGLDYVRGTVVVWLVLGAAVVNLTSGMALATMPAYADTLSIPDVLVTLGATGAYGILMASFAAGNFAGALAANAVDEYRFGWVLMAGFATAGVCWTAAIAVDWLPATALLLALAFVPLGVVNVQVPALIQSAVPESVVGRISSVLSSATVATIPLGSLMGGTLAGAFGSRQVMFVVGFALVAMTAYVLALPRVRTLSRVEDVSI